MNNEHQTSNIKHRTPALAAMVVRRSLFLSFAALFAAPHVFGQTNSSVLPPLIPAYGELPPTFWEQHKLAIIGGGFLFIIVQSVILWKMLMKLQPAAEPPENLARAALNRLLDEPEDGKLLSEVSQILRRYIGAAFQMRGEELTTSEFTAEISRHEKIGGELAEKIAGFLRECDARKFAPPNHAPPVEAVETALDFIAQLQLRLAPADPPR